MQKVRELRGLIYSQFDSETEFAKAIGWPRQRVNKITNGTKEPDIDELSVLAKALNKSVGEIAQIFLRCKSPNEQQIKS
ncbi:helix-turn-helix transcriptional regulator [Clostridium sp. KNHs216]|uniref:helix-turn-helix domain-containing protein n=1 Tax=Clostridium sp. KNHs216 TaxID=1550235 RepID=UPI00163A3CDC|nr:helix-turn-helix transcriptional regulator [Clostridium sp. KNHs216]